MSPLLSLVGPAEPVLFTPAAPVTDIEAQVAPHIEAMRDLMLLKRGIGLAAPQVGIGLRFFITSIPGFRTVINPRVIATGGHAVVEVEGCLTWPGAREKVSRPSVIEVAYLTFKGRENRVELRDFAARVFQHETDHLNGICIFPKAEASA